MHTKQITKNFGYWWNVKNSDISTQ